MTKFQACPVCGNEHACVVNYSEDVKLGRILVHVDGLSKVECAECGIDSVPEQMHDVNAVIVAKALESTRAAVTPGSLRDLRHTWGISQKDASIIFGAGLSAFGKWESGQALSTPSALLVQCATKFPSVMRYLADLAKIKLPSSSSTCMDEKPQETTENAKSGYRSSVQTKLFLAHSASPKSSRSLVRSSGSRLEGFTDKTVWLEAA